MFAETSIESGEGPSFEMKIERQHFMSTVSNEESYVMYFYITAENIVVSSTLTSWFGFTIDLSGETTYQSGNHNGYAIVRTGFSFILCVY